MATLKYRAALVFVVALVGRSHAASYHVGNSLTWDGLGYLTGGQMGISRLAESAGLTYEPGYHIRCNWSLPAIWADPSSVCVPSPEPYGRFDNALPNYDWDFITIQPYAGTTLAQDTAAILNFISLTDAPAYIYQTWPQTTWGEYDAVWDSPAPDDDSLVSDQKRDYFTHLFARVDAGTDAPVRLIPAGEVLYALHEKFEAGELPGVESFSEFYRDPFHMSALGSYVAQATILSVTTQTAPHSFTDPALNPETVAVINSTIWEVLQADCRVGWSDFNGDGVTDAADLALWNEGDLRADADWSGTVDGADLLAWQRGISGVPSILATPEPASLILLVLALGITAPTRSATSG